MRMPLPGIKPVVAGRGQPVVQTMRSAPTPSRVTIPGTGGFGAKTQMPAVAKPMPTAGAGKGSAPGMPIPAQPPRFNLPNPVQAQSMQPPPASIFQPAPGPQNPVGGFQTPPPAMNPPVSDGNFGTIQSSPYPISGVAMPTPNPVPPAPPPNLPTGGMMTPGSLGDQVAQQQTGMMTPGSIVDQVAQQQTGMMALPGMGGPLQSVGGIGGPPRMTFQDWINMGNTPEQAQAMMSQFGSQ